MNNWVFSKLMDLQLYQQPFWARRRCLPGDTSVCYLHVFFSRDGFQIKPQVHYALGMSNNQILNLGYEEVVVRGLWLEDTTLKEHAKLNYIILTV